MKANPFLTKSSLLKLLVVANIVFVQALVAGNITGHVTDAATNGPLPGANVSIDGTAFGAASDRTGDYSIANIPPGTYSLQVSYIGYEDYSAEIVVSADDEAVSHNIAMTASYVEMEAVVISGIRVGQSKALNQQKTADDIRNVVAEEQIQSFPDVNSAEVLQRVPGVAIERDQGEGRYVIIRGTEARMNSMSINGEHIPPADGGRRAIAMDVIPADQLASIEVTKAITPDMDGDAIGGSVNLVTRSALDYDKRILKFAVGSGYNNLMGTSPFNGHVTYGDRFGANRNIGAMVSFSYSRNNLGSDNIQPSWGGITLGEDEDGEDVDWALEELEIRDYAIQRNRMGLSANLDYRLNSNNKFFLNMLYNKLDDNEQRRTLWYEPADGWYESETLAHDGAVGRALKDRWQNQTIYSLSAGGEHNLADLGLDYRVSYSYADEIEADYYTSEFELDESVTMAIDVSDTDLPKIALSGEFAEGYQFVPGNYEFDKIEIEDTKTTNTDITATINAKYPFMVGGNSVLAKVGGKILMKSKDRDEILTEYGWDGEEDLLLSDVVGDFVDDDFLGGEYRIGESQGPSEVRDFYAANESRFEGEEDREASDVADYDASENVIAFYGMATMNIGDLMILGGFRNEITNTEYTGYEVLYDDEGDYVSTTTVTESFDQNHFLPMLHLRYAVNPQTNVRAAFTSGLARPNYETLVPFKFINTEDEELEIGNPALIPTTAYNFDLLGEHYLPGIGLVAAGFFYKSFDKIIFEHEFEQVGGDYDGWDVLQSIQGDKASLMGFEFNWQQQLTFLPAPWDGLGIYANYTYTTSTADISSALPDREDNDKLPLPGQAGNVGNLAVSFQKFGLTSRVSLNYNDGFLFVLGEEEEEDEYQASHLQLDFSASYQILSSLQVYVQANNLTDTPLVYYMGEEDRPIQREFYSFWINAGLKFEF